MVARRAAVRRVEMDGMVGDMALIGMYLNSCD